MAIGVSVPRLILEPEKEGGWGPLIRILALSRQVGPGGRYGVGGLALFQNVFEIDNVLKKHTV